MLYKSFIMNIIKIASQCLRHHLSFKTCRYFTKTSNDNNKSDQEKNENYIKSKIPANKSINKQEKIRQMKNIGFNDVQDLKFLLMGNVIFMGVIPFWAPANIGLCLLNGGYILNRIGQQTKKYLLLVNNNQLEQLVSFRPLNEYLQLIFTNVMTLGFQSLILATSSFQISSMFSMLWIGISIKQKVLPAYFALTLIPLFISIFVNLFSGPIRSLLLDEPPSKPCSQNDKI